MNRRQGIGAIIIPIMLLSSALTLPHAIPPARGAITGIVCIADPTAAKCPETPAILTPASSSDTQITIGVFVNSSASLNGFDIILVADHTIIKPWKVDLTNSIIPGGGPGAAITVQCIGGVPRPGTACSTLDGPDTLHFGALGSGLSFPPTTGLLFSATYNITGTTRNTPIDFKSGCGTPTNPTSDTPVCVTITTGTPQPAPETIQSAGFSNQPFYAIDASPATLVTDIGASNSSLITLTSLNGFAGTLTLSGAVNPSGPTQSLFPTVIVLGSGIQDFSTLSLTVGSSVAPGNYNITVTATNTTLSSNSVVIHLLVPPPDFSISSTPTTLTINATASGSTRLKLTSLNSFAGTVGLTLAPSSGLAASLNITQLKLQSGGSNSSAALTVSASTGGTYTAVITATSGQLTHLVTVSVIALDFGVSSKLQSLSIPQGINQTYTFTITNAPLACCFLGNVTLSTSISPLTGGLAASCAPSLVVFNSRTGQSVDVICGLRGTVLGDYTMVLGGQGRSGKLFHAAVLIVHVQAPDFVITASPQSQTVQAGSSGNITIILTRQSVFNGTLSISASVSPTGPMTALNVSTIVINNGKSVGAAALTITISPTFHPGPITVTITAVNGSLPGALTHQILVTITVATPSTFHDVSIGSLTTDKSSPTIGDKVKYTIVVYNLGSFQEQVTVVALVGDTTVDQQNVTLQQGGNMTVTLTWATSGWTPGTYVLGAKILNVSGETNSGNNLLRSTTPVSLNPTSQGLLSAGNLVLPIGILAALIALIGVLVYLFRYRTRARARTV